MTAEPYSGDSQPLPTRWVARSLPSRRAHSFRSTSVPLTVLLPGCANGLHPPRPVRSSMHTRVSAYSPSTSPHSPALLSQSRATTQPSPVRMTTSLPSDIPT